MKVINVRIDDLLKMEPTLEQSSHLVTKTKAIDTPPQLKIRSYPKQTKKTSGSLATLDKKKKKKEI